MKYSKTRRKVVSCKNNILYKLTNTFCFIISVLSDSCTLQEEKILERTSKGSFNLSQIENAFWITGKP